MIVRRHQLAPNEVDYELLILGVTLGGLAVAAGWLALALPWPRCVFHALTGFPCMTCGATRSAVQFFQGDLIGSWSWNPLVFLTLAGITLYDLYAFVVVVVRAPRVRLLALSGGQKKFVRSAVVVMLLANWAYVLAHLPA